MSAMGLVRTRVTLESALSCSPSMVAHVGMSTTSDRLSNGCSTCMIRGESSNLLRLKPPQLPIPLLKRRHDFHRRRPADAVLDHAQDVLVVIRRKRLMPRAEIENAPGPARPAAAASKNFPAAEAADQHRLLRLGDVEEFAVHFLTRQDEMIADPR